MSDLLTALGLVLVVEGLLFAVFPRVTQRSMRLVSRAPPDQLRLAGLGGALIGAVVVYAVRTWLM